MPKDVDMEEVYKNELENASPSGASRIISSLVVMCAVGGFSWLAWYAYNAGTKSVKTEELVLIEKPTNAPYKRLPDDPGGMQIPHQDKIVFNTFGENVPQSEEVKVAPPPEEPKPVVEQAINEALQEAPVEKETKMRESLIDEKRPHSMQLAKESNEMSADKEKSTAMEEAVEAETVKAETQAAKQAKAPAEKENAEMQSASVAATKTESPNTQNMIVLKEHNKQSVSVFAEKTKSWESAVPEQAAKHAELKPASGGTMLQLGAYRNLDEAKASWEKIATKHVKVLKSYEPAIQQADLGDKGIYYRLRVTGFADNKAAGDTCAHLKAGGQDCFTVKGM